MPTSIPLWKLLLSLFWLSLGSFFFLLPGLQLVRDLNDPALRSGEIPRAAWRLHERLAAPYAQWAQDRLIARKAQLNQEDVSGTEWPLFGSVFYLWSLESLQDAWTRNHAQATVAPAIYARAAIDAAAALVTDPSQGAWVKQKWGPNYLHHQDLFYRFLLISAMTSHVRLTGDPHYLDQLRDQVETLSAEIDASPHGLLEDYPNECYPTDIVGALGAIHRADQVLKTDHSAFIQRALRGFSPPLVDNHQLPPYASVASTGAIRQESRGCGDSFALIVAPELWPATANAWYQSYDSYFWQRRWGLVGFREFAKDTPASETFMDVDSGPVLYGFGFAASAFGTGAARVNGRMDQAAPLTAEMLASSWTLPTGVLLVPRTLSDGADAPYLGEAGILFCLTRQPIAGIKTAATSVMTPFVWGLLAIYLGLGLFFTRSFISLVITWCRAKSK